ncbi:hypothetical protein [Anatilimnocola floriformis]|uniref:hypothetical protein n=1 Tax=Anatilimnocola floriformis TaxID=2948575 RepID=UPI0020C55F49|nr:hypothetical protein [Anatilimnocola floriformis]
MQVSLTFGAQMRDDNGEVRTLSDKELYGVLMPFFARLATVCAPRAEHNRSSGKSGLIDPR